MDFKYLRYAPFGFLLFIFASTSVYSVGVDYDGYFRTRGSYHYNLDLDRAQKPQMRGYSDFRFRLNPNFYVTDKIRFKSSLNFADAVLGDAPFRGVAYSNPAQSTESSISNTDGGNVGRTLTSGNSWVYGGAYAPDAAVRTTDLSPLQVRRAWAEVEFPVGVFKAGRMPFHFGLGIYGNRGDDVDQEIGSTRDRILFESGFGSYYLIPGVSWFYEGNLDRQDDDAWEVFFNFGRKVENQEVAMYISLYRQGDARDASTNGSLQFAKTNYWTVALFGQNQFDRLNLGMELNLFAGDFLGRDLFALNAAARADWDFGKLGLLLDTGYSSGTSDSDMAKDEVKTFAFNRDYNLSYLVFEEALPGGKQLPGDGADPRATSPHAGAISNAFYIRSKLGYEMAKWFHPAINVVVPYAPKKANNAGGQFYGVEYDLITLYPINEYVTGEFTFAHFVPGSFYDNSAISAAHSTILFRAAMNVVF